MMHRRNFFKLLGGGVAVALTLPEVMAAEVMGGLSPGERRLAEETIAAWIHVGENGSVKVFTGKVEVGQNIRTSLAQVVAEELSVPLESVEMIMGDTRLTPYDRGTFGSRTTPYMGPQLRKAAASMREVLTELAAEKWHTEKQFLRAEQGRIVNPDSGESLGYGELTQGEKILAPVNEQVALRPAEEWTVAGSPVPKVNGRAYITGKHRYASDMALPGILYGKVLRPPAYGASLVSADTRGVKESFPGVILVREEDFIGVAAADPQTAENALIKIGARWDIPPQPSKAELFTYLKEHADAGGQDPEVADAFKAADDRLEQTFKIHYIAHAPLEPRAALAKWEDEQLTVWTGTQRPFGVQEELKNIFGIPEDQIRVIMPDTGSGYGGKHSGEAAVEAARLAKTAGKPVKVTWTREEEFKWAYFRPAGVIEVKSSTGKDGRLTSWEFHNYNSGGSGIETPYEVAASQTTYHRSDPPLRQGSYRALASTANVFARECQMDDLAAQLGMDPLEFRLKNLQDDRLKAVLEAAAGAFGWDNRQKRDGRGYGIACGAVKGGYVSTCAEVGYDRDSGGLNIHRVVAAFECGAIVNPRHLKSQVTGCVLQGLGGALFEAVDFKDGRILNPSFSSYRVPRFKDVPELEVVLLDRKDLPSSGAGEAPIVGIAPAIRNAIFDATGTKLNTLPMLPNGLKT